MQFYGKSKEQNTEQLKDDKEPDPEFGNGQYWKQPLIYDIDELMKEAED